MSAILIVVSAIALLIVLIMVLRIHAFLALAITAFVTAILAGHPVGESVAMVTSGFGVSAGNIAIVIGLAVISGQLMQESGAAEKIAWSLLGLTGQKKAPLAMVGSGYILSIPLFSDTSYYLLIPIAKAVAKAGKLSFVSMVVALGCGSLATHCFVPPTPGPLMMAQTLNVDLGITIIVGLAVALLPSLVAGWLYSVWIGKRIVIDEERFMAGLPADTGENKILPSLAASLTPIAVPVVLIAGNTITAATVEAGNPSHSFFSIAGLPVIALFIGTLISYITLGIKRGKSFEELGQTMSRALEIGGTVILITAAGGAFGSVLVKSGIGASITSLIAGMGIPPLLYVFLMAVILKTSQGSSATAMITVSAMMAPLLPEMDLSFHPVYIIMAIASGSMVFSWMNDSGFWVIAKLCNMTEKEAIKSMTVSNAIMGFTGFVVTCILAAIVPMM